MQTSFLPVVEFTAQEISDGKANNLPADTMVLNVSTSQLSQGNPSGAPAAMAGGVAGGSNFEKVQITAANTALSESSGGTPRHYHIEPGGSVATVTVSHIALPAAGQVKQFRATNASGAAQTVTFSVGAGQFSGVLDSQGNTADAAVIIADSTTVLIFVDGDGWVQSTVSVDLATQAELDALQATVNLKANATIGVLLEPSLAMSAGYPTTSVARTFSHTEIDFALTHVQTDSFSGVVINGTSVTDGLTAQLIANTLNTGVAGERTCWFGVVDGGFTKAVKAKFVESSGAININIIEAAHWSGDVLSSASWTTLGGEPASKNPAGPSVIASSNAATGYGLESLTVTFRDPANTTTALDAKAAAVHSHTAGSLPNLENLNGTLSIAKGGTGSATAAAALTALGAEAVANKNANNGYAGLDATGRVAAAQLPSYVDDVIEASNFAALPVTGETGKIYVTLDNNKTFRWSGSAYVEVSGATTVNNTLTSTSTTEALSAAQGKALQDNKQAALVSGTNIKTVNGASLVGAGNITAGADLAGGTSQTALDDGLDAGNAVIDRATVAGQTIIKYQTSGSSTFKVPLNVTSIRALVVGGGGSGGQNYSGGGGAGEVIKAATQAVTPGASYAIGVGVGGASVADNDGNATPGNAGGSSSLGSLIVAIGGGRGGNGSGGTTEPAATSGGSGGGGGGYINVTSGLGAAAGAVGTLGDSGVSFRNAGGDGDKNLNKSGGGGGGAGAAGSAAAGGGGAGNGGAGTADDITGASANYGGGGGGGAEGFAAGTATHGGGGGGRNGVNNGRGVDATANTGGGGGGGAQTNINSNAASGAGGSGIVVIRFTTQTRTYQALVSYADNATAVAAGRLVGEFYRKTADGSVQQIQ